MWRDLKDILQYGKGLRKAKALAVLFCTVGIVAQSLTPFIIKFLINSILESAEIRLVVWGSLAFVAANTASAFGWWFGEYEIQVLQRQSSVRLQSRLLNHFLDLPVSHYRSATPGEIITKISSDGDQLGRLASAVTPSIWAQIINMCIGVFTMLVLEWRLAIVTLFILPLYYITYTRCGALIKKSSGMERPLYDRCINGVREGVEGAETLKLYSKGFFKGEYRDRLDSWFTLAKKLVFRQIMLVNISGYILLLSPIVVLSIGLFMAAKGTLEISVVIAFFTYMGKIFQPVRIFSQLVSDINSIIPMKNRIQGLLDIPSEGTGQALTLSSPPSITMEHVSFSYGSEDVLKCIDMDVKPGECVAVAGRSGTGKSTIMRLLTKFYSAKTGRILLNGHEIDEYNTENLRKVVSYVDQKPYLFDFSVRENIILGREIDKKPYEEACSSARVDFVNVYNEDIVVEGFSDGQRQRIGIARGIAGKPLLLILDEATSAVDSETETQIFRRLKQMSATIIVLSHRLSTLKLVNRIFVLHEGEIVDSGSHDELVTRCPVYVKIFEEKEEENGSE